MRAGCAAAIEFSRLVRDGAHFQPDSFPVNGIPLDRRYLSTIQERRQMLSVPKNLELREKIVQAAAQLFARRGYAGTSTREISRLADVSESTLFRHFGHKEDLFWSALRLRSSDLKLRGEILQGISERDTIEVALPRIVELLRDRISAKPELLRLIAIAFLELHWKAEAYCKECFAPIFSVLNHYLTAEIECNKARKLDPSIVSVAVVTTVIMHPWISKLTDSEKPPHSGTHANAGRESKEHRRDRWGARLSQKAWLSGAGFRGVV